MRAIVEETKRGIISSEFGKKEREGKGINQRAARRERELARDRIKVSVHVRYSKRFRRKGHIESRSEIAKSKKDISFSWSEWWIKKCKR